MTLLQEFADEFYQIFQYSYLIGPLGTAASVVHKIFFDPFKFR